MQRARRIEIALCTDRPPRKHALTREGEQRGVFANDPRQNLSTFLQLQTHTLPLQYCVMAIGQRQSKIVLNFSRRPLNIHVSRFHSETHGS